MQRILTVRLTGDPVTLINPPEWGIEPVPNEQKKLSGRDYFILWSSLGVGLLVLSAGSFLADASITDAILAIVVGSLVGSALLALAGKIGSDGGIPSLISMRPSLGLRGTYVPAILNVIQLLGWTTFEIMIMSRAADILTGKSLPYFAWTAIFGVIAAFLGIIGPLAVARQWLGKFAVWIAYGSSAVIIASLVMSGAPERLLAHTSHSLSFFSALDLVIAMPVSWMPLAADYNRFSKRSKGAFMGTMVGFAVTNILFYFGGLLIGSSDVVAIIVSIQAIFSGFLMLLLLVDEADNAFADVYSAALSTQNIFPKVLQKYLVIGFTALSAALATIITIENYETFLLLISAVFVPLFGVVLSDYYILKRKYTPDAIYTQKGAPTNPRALIAWSTGALLSLVLSPLSPIYVPQLPPIGATIPSLVSALLIYVVLMKASFRGQSRIAAR